MIKDPGLWRRLQDEVRTLMPGDGRFADVKDLETLPFLVSLVVIDNTGR
jgi:hypothetical protein